jgi:hypothetical protein
MLERVAETAKFSDMSVRTKSTSNTSAIYFLFTGMSRTLMRLNAKNLVKDTAFGHRHGATRTWGTSDDGVGIAVSSTSASVCPQSADCGSVSLKHTNENGTITAKSPTVLEGQR